MKKLIYFILFSLLQVACQEYARLPLKSLEGFDEEMRKNGEGLAMDSFFVVPLQTDERCLLKEVKKIIPADTLVVIVSERDVLAFNRQGRFVRHIGRHGHGEGEYNHVSTVYWDKEKDALNVVDGVRNRILVFGLDGRLMDTKFFRPSAFSLLGTAENIGGNRLFCANMIYNDLNLVYSDFDLIGEKSDTVLHFPGRTDNTQEYVGRHPFAVYDGKVVCVSPFDNRIFEYSPETGIWQPWLEVRTEKTVLKDEQLSAMDNYGIFRYAEELSQGAFVGFTDIFVTDRYYFLGFSNLYYAVADKTTGRMVKHDYQVEKDHVSCLPLLNILASDDEGFLIGYADAFELKSWHFADHIRDERLRRMERTVEAMEDDDNPVLLFYRLGD